MCSKKFIISKTHTYTYIPQCVYAHISVKNIKLNKCHSMGLNNGMSVKNILKKIVCHNKNISVNL